MNDRREQRTETATSGTPAAPRKTWERPQISEVALGETAGSTLSSGADMGIYS